MALNPAAIPPARNAERDAPNAGELPSSTSSFFDCAETQKKNTPLLAMVEWFLTHSHADRCTRDTGAHESKAPERSANRVFARSGVLRSPPILKSNASLAATAPESHATADVSLRIAASPLDKIGRNASATLTVTHQTSPNESSNVGWLNVLRFFFTNCQIPKKQSSLR